MKANIIKVIICFWLLSAAVSCGGREPIASQPGILQVFGQCFGEWLAKPGDFANTEEISHRFDQFCEEMFKNSLAENAFAAHFLVSDPAMYGVEFEPEDYVLKGTGWDELEEAAWSCEETMAELRAFDRSALTEGQQLTYDTLLAYLEIQGAYSGTEIMTNYFTLDNNVWGTLATNLQEFPLYDEEDAWQYLSFLKSVPPYISQCLEMAQKQAEEGYFMPDRIADQSIALCQSHYDNDEAVLRTSFADKLKELDLEDGVKDALLEKNEEYLRDYYLPACQETVSLLTELRGSSKNNGGLAGYGEIGRQYYAALVQDRTSSKITPDELADLLEGEIEALVEEASLIPGEIFREAQGYQPDFSDAEQMIQFLIGHMEGDFPAPATTSYQIGGVSRAMEGTNIAAYYMPCRIDNIDNNSIKVNNSMLGRDMRHMYTVIAHETFPGHLYQRTAFAEREDLPKIRKILSFLGVTEGWAEYAKSCAIGYLDLPPKVGQAIFIEDLLPYLLVARVDVGVNYEGWNLEDTDQFLGEYVEEPASMAQGFYSSVIGDPGQFLSYAVGAVKMDQMREQAEEELGEQFDVLAYHQWICEVGITSFDVLEEELEEWVEAYEDE